jgi:sulfur transfer protein SufE
VPGCVSKVYIGHMMKKYDGANVVDIIGAADSSISRGIIAFMQEALNGSTPEYIYSITKSQMLARSMLESIGISNNRLSGFDNILDVIYSILYIYVCCCGLLVS